MLALSLIDGDRLADGDWLALPLADPLAEGDWLALPLALPLADGDLLAEGDMLADTCPPHALTDRATR